MINIENEKDCCGCAACYAICPKECITMVEGSLGHLFPKVNNDKCINCHLCEKVCPQINQTKTQFDNPKVFAAYSKNMDIKHRSSSGGAFGTFATNLLSEGYIVYGAAFDKNLKLECTLADSVEKIGPLMKSKYLQSDLSRKFCEIKDKLNNGDKILFVSTPCQVSALKNYLIKDYGNLITMDFFCHGVPSQKLFDQCLKVDEVRLGGKILNYEFRTKIKKGSTPHYYSVKYIKNGKEKQKTSYYFMSSFYAMFQKYICLRESCYECKYAGKERSSDITFGDFHDINKFIENINRFDGVSTIVINSKRGNEIWNKFKNDFYFYEFNFNELYENKIIFPGPTKKPETRNIFIRDYNEMTFTKLANKWANPKKYIKNYIYYSLPYWLRKKIVK